LGDAIKYARYHVGNNPFAILLGDTLIASRNEKPVTRQLMEVFETTGSPVVALEEVDPASVSRYGVIDGEEAGEGLYRVRNFVEKPDVGQAPSNLAIASRYIFTPEIFAYLEKVTPGKNNEIQLTDAMQMMVREHAMYGLRFDGVRYDIGSKIDFIKTNVIYALKREDFGEEFRVWLKELIKKL